MSRAPGDLAPTAGQTVGPFFHYALPYDGGAHLGCRSLGCHLLSLQGVFVITLTGNAPTSFTVSYITE